MNEERVSFEIQLLEEAAAAFAYPQTPDVRAGVRQAIAAPATESRRAPGGVWLRPAVAAVAVLVVAGVIAITASRELRDAVADFLGLAVEGEQIHILPTPAPGETSTPFPPAQRLDEYATPIAYLEARNRVGFDPAFPRIDDTPQGIYALSYLGTNVIVIDYGRFALWEVRDLVTEKGVIDKSLANATPTPYPQSPGVFEKGLFDKGVERLMQTEVQGRPAYWISGGPHFVRFLGPDGTSVAGSGRTVTRNTLVWRGPAGTNYRLEIEGELAEALRIANSLP